MIQIPAKGELAWANPGPSDGAHTRSAICHDVPLHSLRVQIITASMAGRHSATAWHQGEYALPAPH